MKHEELKSKILKVIPMIGVILLFLIIVTVLFGVWSGHNVLAMKLILTEMIVMGILVFIDKALSDTKQN